MYLVLEVGYVMQCHFQKYPLSRLLRFESVTVILQSSLRGKTAGSMSENNGEAMQLTQKALFLPSLFFFQLDII